MRHGPQTQPDATRRAARQHARCTDCQSVLYDAPVLLDGIPVGRVALRCPHCHDGRALEASVIRRRQSMAQAHEPTKAELAAHLAFQRRAALGYTTKQRTDDEHRAQVVQAIQRFAERHGRPPTAREMGHSRPTQIPGLVSRSLIDRLFGSMRHALEAAGYAVAARTSANTRKGRGMVMRRVCA